MVRSARAPSSCSSTPTSSSTISRSTRTSTTVPPCDGCGAFDLVTNNTDRKGGHCLVDETDHIWAIDNGLSFHEEFKLRTVIWEFSGEPVPADVLSDLEVLVDQGCPPPLEALLDDDERSAFIRRTVRLLSTVVCSPPTTAGTGTPGRSCDRPAGP